MSYDWYMYVEYHNGVLLLILNETVLLCSGTLIRLGYTFKKKTANQILLISDESDEEGKLI
jgi:hypothetical protein